MSTLGLDNPVLQGFGFYAAILIVKMLLMSQLTGLQRFRTKVGRYVLVFSAPDLVCRLNTGRYDTDITSQVCVTSLTEVSLNRTTYIIQQGTGNEARNYSFTSYYSVY